MNGFYEILNEKSRKLEAVSFHLEVQNDAALNRNLAISNTNDSMDQSLNLDWSMAQSLTGRRIFCQ